MKKKPYEKPALQVFVLKQQSQLLAGSEGLNKPSDYEGGGDPING